MGSQYHKIAGVILAGGRSSRMGQNKALLPYDNGVLLDHMMDIMGQSQVTETYISGAVEGFVGLDDKSPFSGPAYAIQNVVEQLADYQKIVFVPVDMPHLTVDVINELLALPYGGYYQDMYLPACLVQSQFDELSGKSVHQMWEGCGLPSLELPQEFTQLMHNCNTPEQWQRLVLNTC